MENRAYFWSFRNIEFRVSAFNVAARYFYRSAFWNKTKSDTIYKKSFNKCRWFWWKCRKHFDGEGVNYSLINKKTIHLANGFLLELNLYIIEI